MKYDNMSLDGEVAFLEEGHKYIKLKDKSFKFNSVTTLLKDFHEKFDAKAIAEKSVKKKGSKYFGRDPLVVAAEWEAYGKLKSGEGTLLHAYGEDLWNGVVPKAPDLPKAKWVPEIILKLKAEGYELAKTEILLYSDKLKLAGQSDILLKKKMADEYGYMIYDWKFLGEKIKMKSHFNPYRRNYVKMTGPFKHLMDCNFIHYSIQLAIYQTLIGDPQKIKEKVLVVVLDDGYDLVPAYPMRVFWDEDLQLQAVYELWNGKFYDSRTDKMMNHWPEDIKGH